jgi:hypothetical protein
VNERPQRRREGPPGRPPSGVVLIVTFPPEFLHLETCVKMGDLLPTVCSRRILAGDRPSEKNVDKCNPTDYLCRCQRSENSVRAREGAS